MILSKNNASRILRIAFLPCLLSLSVQAQKLNTIEVTRRVADYIKTNTTYKFIDIKTKKIYDDPRQAPNPNNLKTESIYNKWEYSNGVMAMGMMQLADVLGDNSYREYATNNFKFIFKNIPFFKEVYAHNPRPEFHNFFRLDRLDDCGALSAALVQNNQTSSNPAYTAYLQKAAAHILTKQTRLADGTLCRDEPRVMTIWADDLYMSVPFLARMGKITGQAKYYDDAIKQVMNFNKYLYDGKTGLYFHTWYSDVKTNGVAHWLRCNGWLAMAQAELIEHLPVNHPKRKELIALLLRQIIGYSRYQDQSGLWHQMLDKPDSYLETSGTAMFTYVVAKAVNEGWIPATYLTIAQEGWKGLTAKVTSDGQIQDVCIGTGIADNINFYYARPTKLNDFHVTGAFLMAGSEMIKAEKKPIK
jgi:unsaturated rhamnogalacturonyl hydrolase